MPYLYFKPSNYSGVNELPWFHGTRKAVAVITKFHHLSLLLTYKNQTKFPSYISLNYILSRVGSVTIDWLWIGNQIYCTHTVRNYK